MSMGNVVEPAIHRGRDGVGEPISCSRALTAQTWPDWDKHLYTTSTTTSTSIAQHHSSYHKTFIILVHYLEQNSPRSGLHPPESTDP
jgi:hypothetical protein